MKRTLKTLGLFIITVLLTFGLAQQTQQTQETGQQTQQTQQQPSQQTEDQRLRDMRLSEVLMELRQMHSRLGQLINELEGQLGFPTTQGLDERIVNLERQARAGELWKARQDLRTLRQDIETGERPEETAREINQIRSALRSAFAQAADEERQRATELEEQLGALEEQVRTGAEEAQATFEEALGRIEEEIERGQQQAQRNYRQRAVETARQRLAGLRSDIEADRDRERVAATITEIRTTLEGAFQDVEGEQREGFDEIVSQLQTLEESVRAGGEQAQQTFEDVMQRFEQNLNRMNDNQGQDATGQGN